MGWIMDINFLGDLEYNGFTVKQGASTQVRWDMGIGEIAVGKDGKIERVHTAHPLEGLEKEDYEKEMLSFTGMTHSTSYALCFYKGELANLDFIGSHHLLNYVQTHLYKQFGFSTNSVKNNNGSLLERTHPNPEGFMQIFAELRQELNDGIVRPESAEDAEDILSDWRDKTRTV